MAPLYRPPTGVATTEVPYLALVIQADPNWAQRKYYQPEYADGAGRAFWANPYVRGAYNRLSNSYPVGAAYGGPDALVAAALAPTVGNQVPGLYEGSDDGKGWA